MLPERERDLGGEATCDGKTVRSGDSFRDANGRDSVSVLANISIMELR